MSDSSATSGSWIVGHDDPLAHFELRAGVYAARLGFPLEAIIGASRYLQGVLGKEFIVSVSKQIAFDLRNDPFPHPLGQHFGLAGAANIMEVLELASFLRTLAHVPGIEDVITHLKNAREYDSTLMQLAVADRLRLAQVEDLELEPPSHGNRRGDIRFTYKGQHFIVECYVPEVHPYLPRVAEALHAHSDGFLDDLSVIEGNRVVKIRPKRPLTDWERKASFRAILLAINTETRRRIKVEQDWLSAEILRSSPKDLEMFKPWRDSRGETRSYGGAALTAIASVLPQGLIDHHVRAGTMPIDRVAKAILLIWELPGHDEKAATDTWVAGLTKSIQGKISQIRTPDNASRIVVVETPAMATSPELVLHNLDRIQRKINGVARTNYSGTLLFNRRYSDQEHRHVQSAHVLPSTNTPEEFYDLLETMGTRVR